MWNRFRQVSVALPLADTSSCQCCVTNPANTQKTLARMIFWSFVIVGVLIKRRGRALRNPDRSAPAGAARSCSSANSMCSCATPRATRFATTSGRGAAGPTSSGSGSRPITTSPPPPSATACASSPETPERRRRASCTCRSIGTANTMRCGRLRPAPARAALLGWRRSTPFDFLAASGLCPSCPFEPCDKRPAKVSSTAPVGSRLPICMTTEAYPASKPRARPQGDRRRGFGRATARESAPACSSFRAVVRERPPYARS